MPVLDEKIYEMTLGEFIERMVQGWGFVHPCKVIHLGCALKKLFSPEQCGRKVEIEYESWTSGWGPDFHYHYRWRIRGVLLPLSLEVGDERYLAPTMTDKIFGGKTPFLRQIEGGFTIGFDE